MRTPYSSLPDTLPEKPSELIRLALNDLSLAEKDGAYRIEMGLWHLSTSYHDGKCAVCFAGAVMANTLKIPSNVNVDPYDFPLSIRNKLLALDRFRTGAVREGLFALLGGKAVRALDLDGLPAVLPPNIPRYELSPILFKIALRELADSLERVGL